MKHDLKNVDLKPGEKLFLGYEFVCPGAEKHLALRFHGQPGTGLDGKDFPRELWEASPHFVPDRSLLALTGVSGIKLLDPPASPPPASEEGIFPDPLKAQLNQWADMAEAADYQERLRADLRAKLLASPVKAEWFVIHDTDGDKINVSKPPKGAGGVCLFVGKGPDPTAGLGNGVHLNQDFSSPGLATKFETGRNSAQPHREFWGKLIHVELIHPMQSAPTGIDLFTDFQYRAAALAFIYASYRAGKWLTVTAHLEVDRGIPNGHWDPRAFGFAKFYGLICTLVGLPAGKTFGILEARIGSNLNDAGWRNTFPAQYGPASDYDQKAQQKKL